MLTFMFWNIRGNHPATWAIRAPAIRTHLQRLVSGCGVDILLLAESAFTPAEVVGALNAQGGAPFDHPTSKSRYVQLFTRLPRPAIADQFFDSADGRLFIHRVATPSGSEILLATMHFQSQMNWSRETQAGQATVARQAIGTTEDLVGHQRTVLVGDLNMNPFDAGVAGPHGLNAVMSRDIARSEERILAGSPYRYFYNPTWSCFGDRTPGPPGSYFYPSAPDGYYWHLFDQVLLRPSLMDQLTDLRIMEDDGTEPLLTTRRRPRSDEVSDHLPLLFRLDL